MRTKCRECRNGIVIDTTICPDCKGTGSDKITIGIGESKGENCKTCQGKGKLIDKSNCTECTEGWVYHCDFCGNGIEDGENNVCATCDENPIVIQLGSPLDYRYLDGKNALAAKVEEASFKSVQVDLGNGFQGWFKPHRDQKFHVGQTIAVRLRNPLTRNDRGNAVPVIALRTQKKYRIVTKTQPVYDVTLDELTAKAGNIGRFIAQIIDIYAMRNGLTLFTLMDSNGKTVQGSVYGQDGRQAYPNLSLSTVVFVVARFKIVNEKERLQIFSLDKVKGNDALDFFNDLASTSLTDGSAIEEQSFFVESGVYDQLKSEFAKAAIKVRNAALRNQNIIIRYHSPCVDGVTGAFAIDYAIKQFLLAKGSKKDHFKRLIRRIPQRNSVFEVREVTRDLSFALDDGLSNRALPLYILVDVGSSEESKAALSICKSYNVDVIVIDTHHFDTDVKENAYSVINPNLINDTENITSGMLSVEFAKFIAPEANIEKEIIQLSAISGKADNVAGTEYEQYMELAKKYDFDVHRIENIQSALDYVIFGLRHFDGGEIVRNILGISGTRDRTTELIESITPTSKSLFAKSLKIVQANCVEEKLDSKNLIYLDFDNFAPRFEYPSHSSLLAALHNVKMEEADGTVVTIGFSSDYLIIRHSALDFNFNDFLEKIQEEHLPFGITGNGQRSAGSIQFLSGHKEEVFETIKKLL